MLIYWAWLTAKPYNPRPQALNGIDLTWSLLFSSLLGYPTGSQIHETEKGTAMETISRPYKPQPLNWILLSPTP